MEAAAGLGSPKNGKMDGLIRARDALADKLLRVDAMFVLNLDTSEHKVEDPARKLKIMANAMRAKGLLESGEIDYSQLARSEEYSQFQQLSQALRFCTVEDLGDRPHQIAFWINVYNSLIIDGIVRFKIKRSVLEDLGFFRRAAYLIAGMRFSADDIEHGVLRGNRKSPTLPFPQLASKDPGLQLSIQPLDPRIHFALVCGANSCPPIAFYDGDLLEEQLDAATRLFINQGGVQVDETNSTISLSRIFKWYRADFANHGGVLGFISKFLNENEGRTNLDGHRWVIKYLPYDWRLNGALG